MDRDDWVSLGLMVALILIVLAGCAYVIVRYLVDGSCCW
jgi:hypothetical protein